MACLLRAAWTSGQFGSIFSVRDLSGPLSQREQLERLASLMVVAAFPVGTLPSVTLGTLPFGPLGTLPCGGPPHPFIHSGLDLHLHIRKRLGLHFRRFGHHVQSCWRRRPQFQPFPQSGPHPRDAAAAGTCLVLVLCNWRRRLSKVIPQLHCGSMRIFIVIFVQLNVDILVLRAPGPGARPDLLLLEPPHSPPRPDPPWQHPPLAPRLCGPSGPLLHIHLRFIIPLRSLTLIQPYSCCSLDIFRDDVGNVATSQALSDQFWGDDLASGDDGLALPLPMPWPVPLARSW